MKSDSVRHQQTFTDTMARYHWDIERLVYSAEITCSENPLKEGVQLLPIPNTSKCCGCRFLDKLDNDDPTIWECSLIYIRRWVGDHVAQHDPEAKK